MLRAKDLHYALKRKKRLDNIGCGIGWKIGQLSKTHSLKCNCSQCRMVTYFKRLMNKQKRLSLLNDLNNELKHIDND